jgi:hypothetical protein
LKIYRTNNLYFPTSEEAILHRWDDHNEEGEPTCTFWEAEKLEPRQGVAVYASDSGWSRWSLRGEELEGDYEPKDLYAEGPMMNYFWPLSSCLRDEPEQAAIRLLGLPVVLAESDDVYGVALAGGGMDLTWSLAAAAVALGYYPWMGLPLSQGSAKSTWEYGVSTVGEQHAKRVRAARRRRLQIAKAENARELSRVGEWR